MWFFCRINTLQCLKISSLCLFGGKLVKCSVNLYKLYISRRCTNIVYTFLYISLLRYRLSVTCVRSVVFSASSGFLHQQNWSPRHNWNIVERGVKHHNPNPNVISEFSYGFTNIYYFFKTTIIDIREFKWVFQ
jgi:hypothetical protein